MSDQFQIVEGRTVLLQIASSSRFAPRSEMAKQAARIDVNRFYMTLAVIVAIAFFAGVLIGRLTSHSNSRCHEWSDGSGTCVYGSPSEP